MTVQQDNKDHAPVITQEQAQNTEAAESRKTGRVVLFSLLGFFAVFASVDAYFVYRAVSSHEGAVVDNPYEMGLNYNDILDKAKERHNDEGQDIRDDDQQSVVGADNQ